MRTAELKYGDPVPNFGNIMDFVRWHGAAEKRQRHNGGLTSTDSSNTFMEWFFAGFERRTGNVIGVVVTAPDSL